MKAETNYFLKMMNCFLSFFLSCSRIAELRKTITVAMSQRPRIFF